MNTTSWPATGERKRSRLSSRWLVLAGFLLVVIFTAWGILVLERQRATRLACEHLRFEEGLAGEVVTVRFQSASATAPQFAEIRDIHTLRRIDLSNTRNVFQGLRSLTAFPSIRVLNLSDATWVADRELQHLAGLPALESLFLDGTAVTSRGLEEFLNDPGRLKQLSLNRCESIESDAVEVLITATQLESLSLVDTGLSAEDLRQLRIARPELRLFIRPTDLFPSSAGPLKTEAEVRGYLLLRTFPHDWTTGLFSDIPVPIPSDGNAETGSSIGFSGEAAGHHLPHLLSIQPPMTALRLSDLRLTPEGWAAIPNTLTELHLTQIAPGSSLEGLKRLTSLERLSLSNSPFDAGQLQILSELPRLRTLIVEGHISEAHLQQLSGLKCLEALHISAVTITDAGLQALFELPLLRSLALTASQAGTTIPGGTLRWDGLRRLNNLDHLWLIGVPLDEGQMHVLHDLPRLRHLALYADVTDRQLRQLSGLPSLERLDLSGATITDVGAAALFDFPKLLWLRLYRTQVSTAMFDSLREWYPGAEIGD